MSQPFSFEDMIASLRNAIGTFPDKRTGKNTKYEMMDAGAGAFSVFFTQCPSFLAHQKMLEERYGLSNAQTLFGMFDVPSDNHIRDLLDTVTPDTLSPVFNDCLHALDESGHLDTFRSGIGENNDLLIALDGTWYFSSSTINCTNCSTKTHKKIMTYYHGMINPAVVGIGRRQAIALPPEFILPQDGDKKQDCEHKAAKRWILVHGKSQESKESNKLTESISTLVSLHVTILGDDLYCHQPMCETLVGNGFNFILVCKPDSHKSLYEWLKGITEEKVLPKHNGKHKEVWTYRWACEVPLKDGDDALLVNWCELTVEREDENGKRKRLYRNAFATNHEVTGKTVELIALAGRTRWKTENENNNTLKTKGYHLEHNYGHGKNHLASLLATMNILAFLFHTMLEFMNRKYTLLRVKIGRRDAFFNDIRALAKYMCFKSFDSMMNFMIKALRKPYPASEIKGPI